MSPKERMTGDEFCNLELKNLACEQQQCFYECLPECTKYEPGKREYLKQNIAYALYGSPKTQAEIIINENNCMNETSFYEQFLKKTIIPAIFWNTETKSTLEVSNNTNQANDNQTISENFNDTNADANADRFTSTFISKYTIDYDENEKNVINKIYDKVCEYATEMDDSQPIYFGIIYNVIFPINEIPKEKDQVKQEVEAENQQTEMEKEKENTVKDKDILSISAIPIFTIRKNIRKQSNIPETANQEENTLIEDEIFCDTWYIDTSARVYKDWSDYKTNNTLPECIMVLPKDGCYQANEDYPITKDYSTVLLEIECSPACAMTRKICKAIDITSTVLAIGGIGLGIATIFTPLAPIAVAGSIIGGTTGAWSISRSSQQLIDRSKHEQSINPINSEAFPHWLGIVGSATGLGLMGGTAALSAVAARGKTVNIVIRTAFNTLQCSCILINGVGIIYQGYCILDTYKKGEPISTLDILNFTLHVMFFANSVITVQFANDIIENTQGQIINDYRQNLRNKNFRRKFNRIKRKANRNNTNKISENAEVIRYIKHRQQLPSYKQSVIGTRTELDRKTSFNVIVSYDDGILKVNNIPLIDPIKFVKCLLQEGILLTTIENNQSDSNDTDQYMQLTEMLCKLLNQFYGNNNYSENTGWLSDYEPLLKRISSANIREKKDFLKMLFDIAVKLIEHSECKEDFLFEAILFIWQYCKMNMKQWGINTYFREQSESGCYILQKILIAISITLEMILDNLFEAFLLYLKKSINYSDEND